MEKVLFDQYCQFLFPVLKEFDNCKHKHGSFQDDRTDGYLAERFTGIFILYAASCNAKIKEISRIDIDVNLKKRMCFHLFPPESNRRLAVKKIVKRIRGNTDDRKN